MKRLTTFQSFSLVFSSWVMLFLLLPLSAKARNAGSFPFFMMLKGPFNKEAQQQHLINQNATRSILGCEKLATSTASIASSQELESSSNETPPLCNEENGFIIVDQPRAASKETNFSSPAWNDYLMQLVKAPVNTLYTIFESAPAVSKNTTLGAVLSLRSRETEVLQQQHSNLSLSLIKLQKTEKAILENSNRYWNDPHGFCTLFLTIQDAKEAAKMTLAAYTPNTPLQEFNNLETSFLGKYQIYLSKEKSFAESYQRTLKNPPTCLANIADAKKKLHEQISMLCRDLRIFRKLQEIDQHKLNPFIVQSNEFRTYLRAIKEGHQTCFHALYYYSSSKNSSEFSKHFKIAIEKNKFFLQSDLDLKEFVKKNPIDQPPPQVRQQKLSSSPTAPPKKTSPSNKSADTTEVGFISIRKLSRQFSIMEQWKKTLSLAQKNAELDFKEYENDPELFTNFLQTITEAQQAFELALNNQPKLPEQHVYLFEIASQKYQAYLNAAQALLETGAPSTDN